MDLEAWLTIAAVCASGAVTPGPSLAVVLKNTVSGGRARGVACAVGHGLGVGIYAAVAVIGLRAVVAFIERPVMVAGAAYLMFMGAQILRAVMVSTAAQGVSAPRATAGPGSGGTAAAPLTAGATDAVPDADAAALAHSPVADPGRGGFREGFLIAFLNPKIAVFFLALLSNLVPPGAVLAERIGVASVAMVIDTLWYVVVALVLAGTGAAGWLRRNGALVDAVFGFVLVGLGGWMLVRALAS
jgi:threonine/homoserine/homoserine lactone efflux protein